jgi:hypothetical protein
MGVASLAPRRTVGLMAEFELFEFAGEQYITVASQTYKLVPVSREELLAAVHERAEPEVVEAFRKAGLIPRD